MLAAKNLQIAEQTFALEALAQSASRANVLEEFPVLFKNGERIEGGVKELPISKEQILQEQAFWESSGKYKKAQEFLKPYRKEYFSETQVRDLIHQTGIPTFPRPQGIPDNFRIKLADKGAGIKYVHPNHEQTSVRVMPGKPHSPFPCQQKPYIIYMKDGKCLDKFGNQVLTDSAEAHIPLEEFVYR